MIFYANVCHVLTNPAIFTARQGETAVPNNIIWIDLSCPVSHARPRAWFVYYVNEPCTEDNIDGEQNTTSITIWNDQLDTKSWWLSTRTPVQRHELAIWEDSWAQWIHELAQALLMRAVGVRGNWNFDVLVITGDWGSWWNSLTKIVRPNI